MERLLPAAALAVLLLGAETGLVAQSLTPDQQQVADAATSFLHLVDAGDFQASYAATAPMFRDNVSPEEWEAAGRSVASQTGAFSYFLLPPE